MLRAIVICTAALACFSLVAFAQPVGEKKSETGKTKDDVNKAKSSEKAGDPKETPKSKTPLDQLRLPSNVLIVVVEDLLKANELIPKQWIGPLDEWLAMKDRIKTLELQLKGDRVLPSECKLVGELKEDFLVFSGEYLFATGPAKTTVPLGLQGGFLTKGAQLDKQPAILEIDKDDGGFVARIEKEGRPHRLVLNFRVPVKKSLTGGLDRSIDLGLPASASTTLDLRLLDEIKELRWNGLAEKPKTPGRWQISLDRSKSLNLAWKEPAPASINAPLVKVENQIRVEVDATHLNITTDVYLEDLRPKTEEWHLTLPPQAKIEAVKGPAGAIPDVKEKGPLTVLRVPLPPTSDRWQVTVSQRIPRPNPGTRVPIVPIQVNGAFVTPAGALQVYGPSLQHGTITVKMPGEASLGQRLIFTRVGKTNQTKSAETESTFQYVAASGGIKTPLELEWRFEKNQLRTEVKHELKLRTTSQGYELDAVTQIRVSALFATVGALDIKLPPPRLRGVALAGTSATTLGFPGALPWPGMDAALSMPWTPIYPEDLPVADKAGNPIKLVPQDTAGKTRVLWTGGSLKQATLELKQTYHIPAQNRRLRLELPRPMNSQDRDAKLFIQADERIELLHGPEGAADPVPERHRFELGFDQSPGAIEIAWRPYQREVVSQGTIDVDLHEHTAQIHQTLRFPRDRSSAGPEPKATQIKLTTPAGLDKPELLAGGEIIQYDRLGETLWVRPGADAGEMIELKLKYDLPVVNKQLHITPIWPAHGSQQDVKVRVWTPAGVETRLAPEILKLAIWRERSIELVRERERFPSLVLAGFGAQLPLTLQIDDSASASMAAFLADRALIQVRLTEEGAQQVQARYWIRKINAPHVDIELPMPRGSFREAPTFFLGNHPLTQWKKLDATEKVLRVQLHPDLATLPAILEITYTVPADALERNSFWHTSMQAPVIRSEVVIAQMRWQLSTPTPLIGASLGRNVRPETQWSLQGWLLTPEPADVDRDTWLTTGKDQGQAAPGVTFAFSEVSLQPETVYHLPRQGWLLGSSGIFLILTLGAYFSPLPRRAFWLLLALLIMGLAILAFLYPAAWAGVAFGLQPGVLLFVVFVSVHLLLQERYRRQLVFLPGFRRPKSGSTITRTNVPKRMREASTVDAPPGAAEGSPTASIAPPTS